MTDMYSRHDRGRIDQLVISRPVYGAEKLVAAAVAIGEHVFGSDRTGFIGLPDEVVSEEQGVSLDEIVPVTQPRTRVIDADNLALRMFEVWSPRDRNDNGRFRYAARLLVEKGGRVFSPVHQDDPGAPKRRTSTLYGRLSAIGLDYDVMDQTDIAIRCFGLTEPVAPHTDGLVHLSLGLHPTDTVSRMLVAQARACQDSLGEVAKKIGYPAGVPQVHIPFCSLPSAITREQGNEFVSLLSEHIESAKLRVGGVVPEVISQN